MGIALELAMTIAFVGLTAPAPPPHPVPLSVPALLERAAARFHVDPVRMRRVVWCESRFDANAVSPGGHLGLAQFHPQTFAWASTQAGYGGASPFNPEANLMAAAWLMGQGGWGHWSCK